MMRHAWLSLGIGLSLLAVGCDDGNSNEEKGEVDGGLTAEDLSNEIKNLQDEINKLGMGQGAIDGRLDVLETPKTPGSCSAGELCIPDGVDLSKQGMQPVIAAICSHEINCCSPGELNLLYGPAIKSAEDCEATFTDMVNNGLSYSDNTLSEALSMVIRVAHALNDTKVGVQVNPTGVTACADWLRQASCPGDDEGDTSGCSPDQDHPCSFDLLLKGTEKEGDTCDPYSQIQECGEGLTCRELDNSDGNQPGICSPLATVGDRCTNDDNCDELFCDYATGTCQARAKEGEACAYVDPTFAYVAPYDSNATKIDCEFGLVCDPATNKCAKNGCGPGNFCRYNYECPSGSVCTRSDSEALANFNEYNLGFCAPPVADGGACQVYAGDNNCASKVCVSGVCLKSAGATCEEPGECAIGFCGTDGKCAAACDVPGLVSKVKRTCADGLFCSYTYTGGNGRCETKVATGACGLVYSSAYRDSTCQSGFCDGTNCQPKVAAGGTCTTGQHTQCPSGQFCLGTVCTNLPVEGAICESYGDCNPALDNGLYCATASAEATSGTCKKRALVGEPCDIRYDGDDCLGYDCDFEKERFLCGTSSMPAGEQFCGDY